MLRLLADLLREFEYLDTLRKERKHFVEPLADVDRLQHVLLFRRLGIKDAGNEIGKRGGRIEVFDRGCHFRLPGARDSIDDDDAKRFEQFSNVLSIRFSAHELNGLRWWHESK